MEVTIEQLKTFTSEITQAVNGLLVQLNSDSKTLSAEDINEIISVPSNYFFVAKESINHKIVGMLTLIIYRIPDGKKAWIEDVVIDKDYRNQGIATRLIEHAIGVTRNNKVLSLNLTSRPEREDANKLYAKLGFKKRDTNVYRIEL